MYSFPAPYEPAGRPVKIEMKQTVIVRIHLYLSDQLNLSRVGEQERTKQMGERRTDYQGHRARPTCGVGLVFHPSCGFVACALGKMGRIVVEAGMVLL